MGFDNGIEKVSLDGFQVVKGNYFRRQNEPAMTLFKSAVSFNCSAYETLNRCETIEILVNEKKKCILIKPVSSKEGDAVRWVKGKEKLKLTRIECSAFAKQLFSLWKLKGEYRYRVMGRVVQCDSKIMMLFDFNEAEMWVGYKMVKENG